MKLRKRLALGYDVAIICILKFSKCKLISKNFLFQLQCRQEGELQLLVRWRQSQGPHEVGLDARALHVPAALDDAEDVRHDGRLWRPRQHARLRGGLLLRQAQQDEPLPGKIEDLRTQFNCCW